MKARRIFQFGKFQIDASARTLRREETIVKLNSRAFDVLLCLVQNPGEVLTRDELLRNVWPDTFVDEHNLAQSISVLRRALEEKPGENSYIVTVPGRGYQFASAVQVVAPEIVASEDGDTPPEAATGWSGSSGLIFQKHTVEASVVTSNEEKVQLASSVSPSRLIRTVAAVLATALTVVLVLRFRTPPPPHPEQKRDLALRQLTANPPDNGVSLQALSRDGKYLAYRDFLTKNLYLLAVDSGEIRQSQLPAAYYPVDWFPDGNHLLLVAGGFSGDLWKLSTWDSSLRKLWAGNAWRSAVSPDGSHIAFINGGGEVWLMGADGEEPRRILGADSAYWALAWSPTGQRLAYIRSQGDYLKRQVNIETCDLTGGSRTAVLSDPDIWGIDAVGNIAWLSDGRIVYSTYSKSQDSELWTVPADPDTGKQRGWATRLAGWKGFQVTDPRASADGKRLIVSRGHRESEVYIGSLELAGKAFTPHRLTLDGWYNEVWSWTKDSQAILFESNRNGRSAIFKQDVNGKTEDSLISGSESNFYPVLSAQGTLLYSTTGSVDKVAWGDATMRLMSTPLQGGASSMLMMGTYYYACGSSPSSSCVVSELKDKQLILSHLDPVKGKGEEIARLDGYQASFPAWDLSPDGSRLAIVDPGEEKREIRILNVADRKITVLPAGARKSPGLQQISWAANGNSLFAVADAVSSWELLSIDAKDTQRVLYDIPMGAGWISSIVPSPNGRSLAFTKRTYVTDAMLLENF